MARSDLKPAEGEAGPSTSSASVQAVHRATSLLLCFDSEHPEWGLSDLVEHTGLLRKTASRLLKTLVSDGFLVLDRATRRYSLGPALFQVAYLWISQASLARIAEPHLRRLTEVTGETASLCVWNVYGPLCVAHADAQRPFRFLMGVGQTFTDLANAHSKILLAFGPADRRENSLARGFQTLTPFTITDPERFAAELNRVVDEGVAYDVQEQQLGVCGLAVPVWDFSGEVRASLSLVMPELRYSPADATRHVQALKHVASALSYDLGYMPGRQLPAEVPEPISTGRVKTG